MVRLCCLALLTLLRTQITKQDLDCKIGDADLPTSMQVLLRDSGVVSYHGKLLVSSTLVPDCDERSRVSQLLSDVIVRGRATKEDRKFAEGHSDLVSSVVKHVWALIAASPAVPSDGTLRHDKWSMLLEPAVDKDVVLTLVRDYVKKSGLSADAAYFLLHRHMSEFIPMAREILESRKSTISERLFATAFLSRDSDAAVLRPSLQELAQERGLTRAESLTIHNLQERLSDGKPATWEDVQQLVENEI